MPNAHRRRLVLGLILLDALMITIALAGADRWAAFQRGNPNESASMPFLLAVTIPMAIALFAVNRLYLLDEVLAGVVEYGRILYGSTLTAFGLSVLGFWIRDLAESVPSRRFIVLMGGLCVVTVGAGRFAARRVVRVLRRRGWGVSRALIVGLGTPGISMANYFQEHRDAGIDVVGFIDDFLPPGTAVTNGLKVLGAPSAAPRIMEETGASDMIVLPTGMAWESFQDLIRTASDRNGHAIRLAPGFRDILATNVRVHQFGSVPLLTIERVRITGLDAILKRLMDQLTALLAAPLAVPVIGISALALLAGGHRPFRTSQVLGRGGKPFAALMLNASADGTGIRRAVHTLGVTRLPQLLNVLRGEMSMIGPRPIPHQERGRFERWIPNLLTVKPGVTGPWALRAPTHSLEEEMRINLFYIRNFTFWLDVEIAARSAFRLLTRRAHPDAAPAAGDGAAPPTPRRPWGSRATAEERVPPHA